MWLPQAVSTMREYKILKRLRVTPVSLVFILAMKSGLTAFDLIYSLTKGGPDGATRTLGLLVYENAYNNNQFGYANALAVVLFVIITIISVVQITLSRKYEV